MLQFIYKIYFYNENICYIGKTINPERRLKEHAHSLKKGRHSSFRLQDLYVRLDKPVPKMILIYCTKCEYDAHIVENQIIFEYGELNGTDSYPQQIIYNVAYDIAKKSGEEFNHRDVLKKIENGEKYPFLPKNNPFSP